MQTDQNLWKDPNEGLVNIFQSGEMEGHLRREVDLGVGPARLTLHCSSLPKLGRSTLVFETEALRQ